MTSTHSARSRGPFWRCVSIGLVASLPIASPGADSGGNYHVSFSAGAAFNISAQFRGHPGVLNLQNSQGQSGATFFDNGYVGPDVSGDPSLTTFWGYNQVEQRTISGGNVVGINYARTTLSPEATSPSIDADPSPSGEIVVRRQFACSSRVTFGVEFAASYTRLDLDDNSPYAADGQRTGYSFGLPGPVDADLFPPAGYQGPFNGLGPVLNLGQSASPATIVPGAVAVTGTRQLEADVFGFRLGPYLEFEFGDKFAASFSAGGVMALINDRVTWSESVSVNSATDSGYWTGQVSARGSECGVEYGYYVGADVGYLINHHWSVIAGCQLQGLSTYKHQIGQGELRLDLSRSLIVNLGVRYRF